RPVRTCFPADQDLPSVCQSRADIGFSSHEVIVFFWEDGHKGASRLSFACFGYGKNGSGEIPSHVSVIEIHVEPVFHGYRKGGCRSGGGKAPKNVRKNDDFYRVNNFEFFISPMFLLAWAGRG
ncbi:MAG: hypothetical protein NTW33_09990, partial [Methanoregula sp.]|nr:hypothetical protein [Methanoregula sp.]